MEHHTFHFPLFFFRSWPAGSTVRSDRYASWREDGRFPWGVFLLDDLFSLVWLGLFSVVCLTPNSYRLLPPFGHSSPGLSLLPGYPLRNPVSPYLMTECAPTKNSLGVSTAFLHLTLLMAGFRPALALGDLISQVFSNLVPVVKLVLHPRGWPFFSVPFVLPPAPVP